MLVNFHVPNYKNKRICVKEFLLYDLILIYEEINFNFSL